MLCLSMFTVCRGRVPLHFSSRAERKRIGEREDAYRSLQDE